ncbi:MAG: hypothetical protein WCI43_07990 [Candidatus Firestonebacteria bacterium]
MKARIILPIAAVLLCFIWINNECVKTGYEITALKSRKIELLNTGRVLQVEISALKSAERIEVMARNDLNMIIPDKYETITVPQKKEEGAGIFAAFKSGAAKTAGFIFSIF